MKETNFDARVVTMKYVRDHLNDTNSTMNSEFRGLRVLSSIPISAGKIPDDAEVLLIPHDNAAVAETD